MITSFLAAGVLLLGAQYDRPPPIEMTQDGTLIYDLDIRDRIMEELGRQGVDADMDGTAVTLVRGPRRTEMSWEGETWSGYAICTRVEPVASNGEQFPPQSFLLIGQNVVMVRDPNPANEVWGAMWVPLAMDHASAQARQSALEECARRAD